MLILSTNRQVGQLLSDSGSSHTYSNHSLKVDYQLYLCQVSLRLVLYLLVLVAYTNIFFLALFPTVTTSHFQFLRKLVGLFQFPFQMYVYTQLLSLSRKNMRRAHSQSMGPDPNKSQHSFHTT